MEEVPSQKNIYIEIPRIFLDFLGIPIFVSDFGLGTLITVPELIFVRERFDSNFHEW